MSLPVPDRVYEQDLDRAFIERGRAILKLIRIFAAEPDQRKARLNFNRQAAEIEPAFRWAVRQAQAALRARRLPIGTCEACGQAMDIIEPGQRYHVMCSPDTPDWPAAPDGPAAGEDEDW
jgi:hypothetical protein